MCVTFNRRSQSYLLADPLTTTSGNPCGKFATDLCCIGRYFNFAANVAGELQSNVETIPAYEEEHQKPCPPADESALVVEVVFQNSTTFHSRFDTVTFTTQVMRIFLRLSPR